MVEGDDLLYLQCRTLGGDSFFFPRLFDRHDRLVECLAQPGLHIRKTWEIGKTLAPRKNGDTGDNCQRALARSRTQHRSLASKLKYFQQHDRQSNLPEFRVPVRDQDLGPSRRYHRGQSMESKIPGSFTVKLVNTLQADFS